MTRRIVTAFLRFCLRVFYKHIEMVGLDRIPNAPVIFAVNHPNSLLDPLFVLCFAPRRISFLGKAPLFHWPVIGWVARAIDSIPVYRKQDETPGSNLETFRRSREILRGGGSIAIFPEGTTHSDPQLRGLKTGVARIALGARLDELYVVPTGIYYTAKHVFRSAALVVFGDAIRVPPADEDARDEVVALTRAIDEGLDAVTLQADSHAALELIARAEDIFTADERHPLSEELELRRRFVDGYRYLETHDPARLERLASAITQLAAELRRAGLDPHELKPRIEIARVIRIVILLPLATIGTIINYPAYRLAGFLAKRISRGEDELVATIKILASFALFPLTWIALTIYLGSRLGLAIAIASLIAMPLLAYSALRVSEDLDDVIGDLRGLFASRDALVRQREAIREEILAIAEELG
jgi:glycerol-3-phosphate O-acyltransferase/dihydroxyacetone phosphate acyltransferase